jgi:glycogen synthase
VTELTSQVDIKTQATLKERWPQLQIGPNALLGISVGRMEANKGFEYLLRALARLNRIDRVKLNPAVRPPDWRWVFIGEGSLRLHLEEVAAQLGLANKVVFTGKLSDTELHSLYAMCNLFAHPTLYEGSSLVTLEAMAHGLPVVASAVGGIPDKVIEGQTGFLVQPRDDAALAAKLHWMLEHPAERSEMGRRGAQLAQEQFSWKRVAAQTEELFCTLFEEKAVCS